MSRGNKCNCCGVIAAVFEGWGPTLNHWNYAYCAMQEPMETYNGFEPYAVAESAPKDWQWQFRGPLTGALTWRPFTEVYRPSPVRLNAAGCAAFNGIKNAIIRMEFGAQKTRLQAFLYNRYDAYPFTTNLGCQAGVGPSSWGPPTTIFGNIVGGEWTHKITYEIDSSDYQSISQNGVFRFTKDDVVDHEHFGQGNIYFLETTMPVPLLTTSKPVRYMSTNVEDDIGDIIIVRSAMRHSLHDRDLLVTFGASKGVDESGLANCHSRKTKYRVDAIRDVEFEFAVDNPPLDSIWFPAGIAAAPEDGPCANPGGVTNYDGLVSISRIPTLGITSTGQSVFLTGIHPSAVTLIARGSFSSWSGCRPQDEEGCGNNSGDVNRYDRPTLYFTLDDIHWSALANEQNEVQLSFGTDDRSPFWMPGWSWPGLNPATITIKNLNPTEEPTRLGNEWSRLNVFA